MENQYVHPANGAEVVSGRVDEWSKNAALADDRVLWELLRLVTGSATPQKAILPYGKAGWVKETGLTSTALIHGNASNGSVLVMPFRAIVGSTSTTPEIEEARGIRSGYLVGSSTQYVTIPIAANVSGNPRWTLIYAAVAPDANGDSATYVIKDPVAPHDVSSTTSVVTKKTTVTVIALDGTPGASPTRPSLPADGAGVYNIALAYLWIPTGFGGSSAVGRGAIQEVAPCLPLHSTSGACSLQVANQQYVKDGTVYTRQATPTNQAIQPGAYLPPTMTGSEGIQILLQRAVANFSHNDGDLIDTSRDWRFRYFTWKALVQSISTTNGAFASDRNFTPSAPTGSAAFSTYISGGGQSFRDDSGSIIAVGDSQGAALWFNSANAAAIMTGAEMAMIYVRNTDGALIFKFVGSPVTYNAVIWLEATGPYSNFGTV